MKKTNWLGRSEAIMVKDDTLTEKDCQYLINLAEQQKSWRKSITLQEANDSKADGKYRTSQEYKFPNSCPADEPLFKLFNLGIQEYWKNIDIRIANGIGDEGYRVLKYEPGNHYVRHVDASGTRPRFLSAILYLNDVEEGGETEFIREKVTVEPKRGRLILFPSNFLFDHEAKPVKKGLKYVIVTFFVYKG